MRKQLKDICRGFTKNIALKDLGQHEGRFPIYGASGYIKDVDFYCCDTPYIGIVKDGSGVGRVDVYPGYSSLLGTMQYIVPNNEVDLQYLKYALKAMDLGSLYKGAAIPHIYFKEYGKFFVDLPDLETQKHISASLDTIQKAIDLKRKQLQDLDELVKSKFQEMFGDPVENDKRWEMRVWKELFDTILGKMLDVKKQNSDDEIRLYLGNTNVQWRSFDLSGLKTMTFSNKEIDKLSLKKSDVLICEGGESGRCAVWEEENSNILFQKAIHRARIKDPNVIEPHFIPFLMEFLRENNGLKNYVTQATIEHLTGEKLNKLSIIVPPIEQQKVFAEFARKADAANAIIKQEISDLEELMDSKMDEYFG